MPAVSSALAATRSGRPGAKAGVAVLSACSCGPPPGPDHGALDLAVVHGGAVGAGPGARQVGTVPCAIPGPLPSQRVRSAPARGARAGLATVAKPPPACVEACAQGAHRCRREAPAPRGVPRPLPAVKGLGCNALRGLLPAMPAAPRQWPAAAAALQGQLVTRCHGRFLRTVSENPKSSHSLPDRFLTHFKIDSEERWAHRLRQAKRPTTSGD